MLVHNVLVRVWIRMYSPSCLKKCTYVAAVCFFAIRCIWRSYWKRHTVLVNDMVRWSILFRKKSLLSAGTHILTADEVPRGSAEAVNRVKLNAFSVLEPEGYRQNNAVLYLVNRMQCLCIWTWQASACAGQRVNIPIILIKLTVIDWLLYVDFTRGNQLITYSTIRILSVHVVLLQFEVPCTFHHGFHGLPFYVNYFSFVKPVT